MQQEVPAQTRLATVMETIRGRIAARAYAPGTKLPSIRETAATLRVSKSTAVEAYDRLVAEGAITARRGSGFYVAGHTRPLSLAEIGPRLDRAIDPLWVTRQSLEAGPEVLKPGCGWLPPSWLPEAEIGRALRAIAREPNAGLTDYDTPLGLSPLRQLLSRRLAERGIEAPPDRIILTESGTQAIDLLCRFLLEPGDSVLVDDPCYFNFHAMLKAHRAKVVGVPYTPNGPDPERFAEALRTHRPRLYLTNSGIHNPTGAVLSPAVAHRILKLAEAHDLLIIEDDIFADLETEPAARLAGFDGLNRVIQIGSFSKTISASIRCGYIAARAEWIEPIVALKLATTFSANRLSAEVILRLLTGGGYRRHVESLRTRLAEATGRVRKRLIAAGLTPWMEPRGGMFLWMQLPEGLDAAEVAQAALAENVVLAPGNVFSAAQTAVRYLRFNVGQSSQPKIYQVLKMAVER